MAKRRGYACCRAPGRASSRGRGQKAAIFGQIPPPSLAAVGDHNRPCAEFLPRPVWGQVVVTPTEALGAACDSSSTAYSTSREFNPTGSNSSVTGTRGRGDDVAVRSLSRPGPRLRAVPEHPGEAGLPDRPGQPHRQLRRHARRGNAPRRPVRGGRPRHSRARHPRPGQGSRGQPPQPLRPPARPAARFLRRRGRDRLGRRLALATATHIARRRTPAHTSQARERLGVGPRNRQGANIVQETVLPSAARGPREEVISIRRERDP